MNLLNPHFTIFGIDVYYYAVIIVTGMVLASVLTAVLFHHRNIKYDLILDFFVAVIPLALVGARVFYCVTDGVPFSQWITGIKSGGLSIIGGVMGGACGIAIVCLIKKINFFRIADCILPNVFLGQAIGRWGNFVNQEVYGKLITNPSWQFFPAGVLIDGEWHVALFFIESIINLTFFVLLFIFAWKYKKKPIGLITGAYLFLYGIVRTIMEPLRDAEFILGSGGVKSSQVMSIIFMIAGIAIIVTQLVLNKKKEGVFFGSVNGESDGTLPRIGDWTDIDKKREEKAKLEKENSNEQKVEVEKKSTEEESVKEDN